ncbi:MAG TPA: ribokinase [Anaerolineae bacterium]|nr:ribokinase [Anaerolineae bacterium]
MRDEKKQTVDFLVVGHLTRDLHSDGDSLGGTAAFAAVTAKRLGWRTGILTRAADLPQVEMLSGIYLHRLPAEHTTTFRNIYLNGSREQFVHAVAPPICAADLPSHWQQASVVLLGPVADEVDPALAARFPNALVGAVPQGWMRRWDEKGKVTTWAWEPTPLLLEHVDVMVLSEEDLGGDYARATELASRMSLFVLTLGKRGSVVYLNGKPHPVPPRPARQIDPTGAGDVFTAAFLIRLYETSDPLQAARFANVVASYAIEALGVDGIPSRDQVEAYLAEHNGIPIPS